MSNFPRTYTVHNRNNTLHYVDLTNALSVIGYHKQASSAPIHLTSTTAVPETECSDYFLELEED